MRTTKNSVLQLFIIPASFFIFTLVNLNCRSKDDRTFYVNDKLNKLDLTANETRSQDYKLTNKAGWNLVSNNLQIMSKNSVDVKELRIILTVDNLEDVVEFYKKEMGLKSSKEWNEITGNGVILEAGLASLELVDRKHAQYIDAIEVGKDVSGPVRLAFNIGNNIKEKGAKLEISGAVKIANVKKAPWSKVQRMQDPGGMQFTLFENSTLFPQ